MKKGKKTEESRMADNDVQAMVALLSETCRHASRNAQIRLLMEGIRQLVGAKAWVWGASVRLSPEVVPTWVLHQYGGFTEQGFAKLMLAQEHPDMQRLTAPFVRLLAECGGQLTRTRDQTDPDGTFRTSPAKPLWDDAGVSPGIMSCWLLGGNAVSVACIFRGKDEPPFDERERTIAHVLLTEVPWLHLSDPEEVMMPVRKLGPRKMTVSNLLIQGQTRKEIAGHLGLTENTVNSYVKEVLTHFNVHSQAELMSRFRMQECGTVDSCEY